MVLTTRRLLVRQVSQIGFLSTVIDFAKDILPRGKDAEPAAAALLRWRHRNVVLSGFTAKGPAQKGLLGVVIGSSSRMAHAGLE